MGETTRQQTFGKLQTKGDISTVNETTLIFEHEIKANQNIENVSTPFPMGETTRKQTFGKHQIQDDISTVDDTPLTMEHESAVSPNVEDISANVDVTTHLMTNGHTIPTKEMSKTQKF